MTSENETANRGQEALGQFLAILDEYGNKPGVSDITVRSDGELSVRNMTKLTVVRAPAAIAEQFDFIVKWVANSESPDRIVRATREIAGRRYRMLVTRQGKDTAIFIRPLAKAAKTAEEQNIPVSIIERFLTLQSGIVLFLGPTGSGKSTTISCALTEYAKAHGGNMVTLESPIEIMYRNTERCMFNQYEVGEGKDFLDYAEGIEAALQMDPDVLMVQELRNCEAAQAAVEFSQTGHLVIATIHGDNASQAPQRLASLLTSKSDHAWSQDYALEMVASNLQLVVAQQMKYGENGLVPIFELLPFCDERGKHSPQYESLIVNRRFGALRSEMEQGAHKGMITFERSIQDRQDKGLLPWGIRKG